MNSGDSALNYCYGDGMNCYAYVGGDPVNFRDPSGLAGEPPPDPDPIVVIGSRPRAVCDGVEIGGICVLRSDFILDQLNTILEFSCDGPVNSLRFGGEGSAYIGAGVRAGGEVAYDPKTGGVTSSIKFGTGIGLGGGGSFGLSGSTSGLSTSSGLTLDTQSQIGLGLLGGGASYNHRSRATGGQSGPGQGRNIQAGIAKGHAVALIDVSANAERLLYSGNVGAICPRN